MKEKAEEYFVNYGENIRELVQRVQAESRENGRTSYEAASLLMETAIVQDSDILIGIAYFHLAEAEMDMEDKENVKICLLGCINYLQGKGPYEYIAKAYYLLGETEKVQNNPIMAMEYYESGLAVCGEKELGELKTLLLRGIGSSYFQLEQPEKALLHYNECLRLYRNSEYEYMEQMNYARALIERAKCFLILKRIKEAKQDKELLENILCFLNEPQILVEAYLFFALYSQEEKDNKKASDYTEKAGTMIEEGPLAESQGHVREYLSVLIRIGAYKRLAEALKRLRPYTDKSRDKNYRLHILYLGIRYTSEDMEEDELRASAGEFFLLYELCAKEKNDSLIKNIEVRRQLRQIQEKQHELKILNQKLLRNSLHDALTGLPNRGYLNEHAEKVFERARANGHFCGICLLDIDYFKQLNDKYGHLAGDRCLKAIGGILDEIRNGRIFSARYGGDEFTLVFYRMNKEEIGKVLDKIQKRIKDEKIPNEDSKVSSIVTLSMGCFCCVPVKEDKMWDYFSRADAALYQAKYLGKDGFVVFGREGNDIEDRDCPQKIGTV